MSRIADSVFDLLKEVFPYAKIKKEYYVVYSGQKLYVDFFIPSYLIAVEVHGRQHDEFVEHFHSDEAGWKSHRMRDRVKEEWAVMNNITYVVIRESNLPKTKEEMLNLIRTNL